MHFYFRIRRNKSTHKLQEKSILPELSSNKSSHKSQKRSTKVVQGSDVISAMECLNKKARFQRLHSLIVTINVTLISDLRTQICHEVGLIVSNWQKTHSAIFCWRALFKPQRVSIWRDPCEAGPGNLNCHVRRDSGNLRLGQFYATLQTHPTLTLAMLQSIKLCIWCCKWDCAIQVLLRWDLSQGCQKIVHISL